MSVPAVWWSPLSNGRVACGLCPIGCRLREGRIGPCGTRANRGGLMELLHYGRLVASAVDPIEKKPLYHFHPGRSILSVAAPGCNLHCAFCQNWNISQQHDGPPAVARPDEMVAMAEAAKSLGIAYTYSEPLVWYEFVRDTGRLARAAGLKNVLVSNGFINAAPLAELMPLIDAANIDLKSMDDRFYRRICKARLAPVLAAIRACHAAGVHLELTNLVIPGHNDTPQQIARLVDFVAELDPTIPLHLTAYHPAYRLDAPATPRATLERAYAQAREKLDWVYVGNLGGAEGRDTLCPSCGCVLVRREGFRARVDLAGGTCPECGTAVPVVGV